MIRDMTMPRFACSILLFISVVVAAAAGHPSTSSGCPEPVEGQAPAPGFADAILGRWDLTVQGADGPYQSWLEIMLRKETELMGRFAPSLKGRRGRGGKKNINTICRPSGGQVEACALTPGGPAAGRFDTRQVFVIFVRPQ